ncbi:MAG: phosphatidate cytidylyltransferase [Dehalococcoidia bacterium]
MLRQRLIVAAAGIPLLALLLVLPEPAFALAVQALLAVATFEMVRAAAPHAPLSVPVSAGAAAALLLAVARVADDLPIPGLLAVTAASLGLLLAPRGRLGDSVPGWWTGAVLYVGVAGAHFLFLRNLVDGREWLVVLLAVTFATDTGAYVTGRLLGRHRLAPAISPNKTWEGLAGGLVLGAVVAVGVLLGIDTGRDPGGHHSLLATVAWAGAAVVALVLPVAAIAGDLLESALKRRIEVKDMSGLLPGHGGLLDRLDSLLLAAPCLYWIVQWFQA